MTARGTDWGLAALVALLVATGVMTLFAGAQGDGWVFAFHDACGVAIALLLIAKVRRVWSRVRAADKWDRRTGVGLIALLLVMAGLISGFLWSDGVTPAPGGYSLLSWHEALGAALAIAVGCHMLVRARRIRRRDLAHRRQFLLGLGGVGGAFIAWRLQRPAQALFGLRGARRRFTGSYEVASFAGNAFPSTSWVADHPRPIDPNAYRLEVHGLVVRRLTLSLPQLEALDEFVATLDCTGGFYSTQRWRGIRLDRLLSAAGVASDARHLRVVSRTGYRWSFALSDAPRLLLARYVGDEALSYEHGSPLRLVVPDGRGFQWVKWVVRVELLSHPDYAAPASTVWSSFTAAGSGGV